MTSQIALSKNINHISRTLQSREMCKPLKYHALAAKCYSISACCINIFTDSQESFSYIFLTSYTLQFHGWLRSVLEILLVSLLPHSTN